MVALSHLKSLQALEMALRTGSLRAAAQQLAITPAAVGQRVKALEEYLGVELLVRGRTGLKSTPALEAALTSLHTAFQELQNVACALDLQRHSEIHVAASPDFAELWLKPRLARFCLAHPHTHFCINGEGTIPLRLGPADCEITFGPPPSGSQQDLLFRDFVLPVCSPETTRLIAGRTAAHSWRAFPSSTWISTRTTPLSPGGRNGPRPTASNAPTRSGASAFSESAEYSMPCSPMPA